MNNEQRSAPIISRARSMSSWINWSPSSTTASWSVFVSCSIRSAVVRCCSAALYRVAVRIQTPTYTAKAKNMSSSSAVNDKTLSPSILFTSCATATIWSPHMTGMQRMDLVRYPVWKSTFWLKRLSLYASVMLTVSPVVATCPAMPALMGIRIVHISSKWASSCCFCSFTMKSEHLSLEVSSFAELMTCADSRRTSSVAHARAWARESIVSDLRYSWLATWNKRVFRREAAA
mmetsp:Transcript_37510/g.66848  ORF Transcript_37510/g.66848 Transcript_37510/m.66848 type:complete len:232 (+) Transcript_37510:453-1148(+)